VSLITVARYRTITGDQTTASALIEDRIDEAVELLEEHLGRPLVEASRVERCYPTRDGYVWPRATPILSAPGFTIDGNGLRVVFPLTLVVESEQQTIEVTYTGGYVERTANPSADNRLPGTLERAIAWAAKALGSTTAAELVEGVPANAKSVSLGDLSVTFDTVAGHPADMQVRFGRQVSRYAYRRPRGTPGGPLPMRTW
jgi:hypothetical protein